MEPNASASKLILRELNENDESAFFEGLADWSDVERTWFTFGWKPGVTYLQMLARLRDNSAGRNIPEGFVASTMLYAFVDGRIVGRFNIRYTLNDHLRERGGHVGYAVAEKFRCRGYATEILKQGLPICSRLGLTALMFSCADANVASWKMIERTGAVRTGTPFDEKSKELIRTYWLILPLDKAGHAQATLETARLRLRPFALADGSRVRHLANDKKISATTTLPYPYSLGLAEEWIAKQPAQLAAKQMVQFAVVQRESDELIGVVSLFGISVALEKAELGYWVGVDYWNKGYCTEAVKALLGYGFGELKLNKIYARHVGANLASGAVMEKAGMQKEGTLRQDSKKDGVFHDLITYAMLSSDYKTLRELSSRPSSTRA